MGTLRPRFRGGKLFPPYAGYNSIMNRADELPTFDYEGLKRDLAEAVRAVIRERAAALGLSYDDYLDLHFRRESDRGAE